MRRFDLISDIHLDFWVKDAHSLWSLNKKIRRFAAQLLPENGSRTLLIAGDLGHSNQQNYMLLKFLKEHYQHIVLVWGNHDYYLSRRRIEDPGGFDSIDRIHEMRQLASQLPGVYCLEGTAVTLDGITYGGCGMWYDLQYGVQVLKSDMNHIFTTWRTVSNDYALIRGKPRYTMDMFKSEQAKLERILTESDVLLTHVSPDWSRVPEGKQLQVSTSFYYFDGAPYFQRIAGKVWCFGHIHHRMDYTMHQCRFINGSLGYPKDNPAGPKRIVSIDI
ncbi:metallophosphoesterase family protein [Paenibacillus hexagrammi]|uniref:Metallophosphoesterase n=1 Tax=Paenibacillus hexagrammi TaxID=2908839 RepID=A0ABY3SPS5_9BACL|nr:metallophosphoesterase [Paenibacillus sp. YPD9-1]UJF35837.1 metallophosphoesterase [Paenibacillus sp. YPD9-1]